jgi:DNA primase
MAASSGDRDNRFHGTGPDGAFTHDDLRRLNNTPQLFIVELPAGEDPDSVLRTQGVEALRDLVGNAKPWYQYWFDRIECEMAPGPEGEAVAFQLLLPTVRALDDPVLRAHYSRRLAALTHTSIAIIADLLGDRQPHRGAEQKGWFGGGNTRP